LASRTDRTLYLQKVNCIKMIQLYWKAKILGRKERGNFIYPFILFVTDQSRVTN